MNARTADVVIIGGGVTGTSLAFHLARRGVSRVVLLERKFLAAGGTGRSVGIIRQLYPMPETCRMVLESLRVFQHFPELVGGESGYVGCGALIGVSPATLPALARSLQIQREAGIRAELLEPEELSRIEPRINRSALGAVLYEPESGYGDPTGVTLGYARAARDLGVAIEQGTAVTEIRLDGDRVAGVVTDRGERIESRAVVNAAGLWAGAVAALAGVALPLIIGRHPVFIVKRGPAFGRAHPVYLDLAGGSYVRPETGNLTLTGSLTEDESRHPMDPDLLGSETGFEEAASALEKTSRALPLLADCQYQQGYAGAFDITPDWMPILDESPVRGFYIAAGMSGHGFKLAPAVGELMAELITDGRTTINRQPFAFDRFAAERRPTGDFVGSFLRC
ncbi:MAG: FAD-binding oxidoreductase [Candidatus Rokubacteria bacterium]|nr:FAD-binding oxidoreductase [Candidatus Rokubacteria bacterium]